jgi:hypothetical protein
MTANLEGRLDGPSWPLFCVLSGHDFDRPTSGC